MSRMDRGTPEWTAAWEGLRQHLKASDLGDGSDLAQESEYGERWQYMGTYDGVHEFRHREHPITNRREYYLSSVTGSQGPA